MTCHSEKGNYLKIWAEHLNELQQVLNSFIETYSSTAKYLTHPFTERLNRECIVRIYAVEMFRSSLLLLRLIDFVFVSFRPKMPGYFKRNRNI